MVTHLTTNHNWYSIKTWPIMKQTDFLHSQKSFFLFSFLQCCIFLCLCVFVCVCVCVCVCVMLSWPCIQHNWKTKCRFLYHLILFAFVCLLNNRCEPDAKRRKKKELWRERRAQTKYTHVTAFLSTRAVTWKQAVRTVRESVSFIRTLFKYIQIVYFALWREQAGHDTAGPNLLARS